MKARSGKQREGRMKEYDAAEQIDPEQAKADKVRLIHDEHTHIYVYHTQQVHTCVFLHAHMCAHMYVPHPP